LQEFDGDISTEIIVIDPLSSSFLTIIPSPLGLMIKVLISMLDG
jgi:hypothetical protein